MSRALRLALCALVSLWPPGLLRGAVEVKAIEMTVSQLPAAIEFYTSVLTFQLEVRERSENQDSAQLRLGEETLILHGANGQGRPIPRDLSANDLSFQHIAIVVSDMDAAYRRLLDCHVRIVSDGVQTLPDWNFDAAGIRALYFRDPEAHFLELIQFPPNKGEPRWHWGSSALFLGIDHSALVEAEMQRSLHFYRDQLGFKVIGESYNYGGEQEHLNRVAGSRLRVTSLRGAKGPGLELLQYEAPGLAQALPGAPQPNDNSYWRIRLLTADRHASGSGRDPDGHPIAREVRKTDPWQAEYAGEAFRQHWDRYLMEGAELGIFMAVALFLALLLEHPRSRLHKFFKSEILRRFFFGFGIGLTVVLLIYCTWGRQSGAQFNPAVTLSMLYLQRIQPWDAFFYIIAQFIGGGLGVMLAAAPFWKASAHKKVNFVVTLPGKPGVAAAFAAEFIISFILMATLRLVYQHATLKPLIGYFAGLLLLLYITFEVPFSGMSLNPARSVASAIPARNWKSIWIYFLAPTLAMLLAAILFH